MRVLLLLLVLLPACAMGAVPQGKAQLTADLDGTELTVFTWRPSGCEITGILLVFHGLGRNAPGYRNDAVPLGQALCRLVVAPLFDTARFPTWRYQRGGIVHDGAVLPEADWTVMLVPRLVEWTRQQEGRPELPYDLIGHSAGGQFLSRVAAFAPLEARRIVIANPSTWVRPSLDITAPYGFGGAAGEAALKRYLGMPVTVLLGQEDTGSKDLATGEEADAQGATRLERGRNVFREARQAAAAHGWPFNWRLAIVPGAAHSAGKMFASDQALQALRP
jgi:pimeloyl-ACP methyl ester carboxylesterase